MPGILDTRETAASFFPDSLFSEPLSIGTTGCWMTVFAPASTVAPTFQGVRMALYLGGGFAAILTGILVMSLGSSWAARQEAHGLREEIGRRILAQKAMEESEKRFRLLVENAPEAIFIQTRQCFAYLNTAALELFGADSAQSLLGTEVLERVHADYRDLVRERMETVSVRRQAVSQLVQVYLRLDGSPRHVDASAVPFHYQGEDGSLVFLRDITEFVQSETRQRALEDQLNQAQKMEAIGRLAGGVAHDFNNLLTVILGYGELLTEDFSEDHPHRDSMEEMYTAALRARDLTRQLLAFSRKQILEMTVLDLNAVVAGVERMLGRVIGEDIRLDMDLADENLNVYADASQLEQVMMNLAVNARDAMPQGGQLSIQTSVVRLEEISGQGEPDLRQGSYAVIRFADDGCGMDRDVRSRLFEPFFTTKEKDKGTGLGLATSYGIVRQQGGTILVESAPGQGSTFSVLLPLCAGRETEIPTIKDPPPPRSKAGSATILVVEDDLRLGALVCSILSRAGFRVIRSDTAEQAVSLAARYGNTLDLVLSDVIMPGMKGPEVYAKILEYCPDSVAVFMSGYTGDRIGPHENLLQGSVFIQKPFTTDQLLTGVNTALGSAGQGFGDREI